MKILAVQSRMGIGDTVIFLPYIRALSKKFNSPISILVKENSKADQYLYQTSYIDKILILERDNKNNNYSSKILEKVDFTLLHCITIYPTPLNDMNLLRMNWLKKISKKS